MKKSTIAYATAGAITLVLLALLLRPERGETPALDVLAPSPTPAAAAADDVRTDIVGTWRSADDAKYAVSFFEDGSVTERYESDAAPLADSTGRWIMMIEDDALSLVTTYGEDRTYVYSIVAFDSGRMTLRERDAIRDNHFVKETE